MRNRILAITLATALLAGCAGPTEVKAPSGARTHVVTMQPDEDGYARSYRVHVPASYRPGNTTPLVIVVHGAFSDSGAMEKHTGFSALAEREGFVVAYPDGIGLLGFLQHWNAGHCCGKAAEDGIDDVGFITTMIDEISSRFEVDPRRVYMVGFSNGAMLTHRIAAEKPRLLAAIAPLAGSIGSNNGKDSGSWKMPKPRAAVPVIMFHGLDDERVPYAVGAGGSSGYGFSSVAETSRFWFSENGCVAHRRTPFAESSAITVDTWSGCEDDATVQLYSLAGWGHRWPGRYFTEQSGSPDALTGFDAAEIIWTFFSQHTRREPKA